MIAIHVKLIVYHYVFSTWMDSFSAIFQTLSTNIRRHGEVNLIFTQTLIHYEMLRLCIEKVVSKLPSDEWVEIEPASREN